MQNTVLIMKGLYQSLVFTLKTLDFCPIFPIFETRADFYILVQTFLKLDQLNLFSKI